MTHEEKIWQKVIDKDIINMEKDSGKDRQRVMHKDTMNKEKIPEKIGKEWCIKIQ